MGTLQVISIRIRAGTRAAKNSHTFTITAVTLETCSKRDGRKQEEYA
jgi:hypothetical protein